MGGGLRGLDAIVPWGTGFSSATASGHQTGANKFVHANVVEPYSKEGSEPHEYDFLAWEASEDRTLIGWKHLVDVREQHCPQILRR